MFSISYLLITLIYKLDKSFKKNCWLIYNLLFTRKYAVLKQFCYVPIGFFIGYTFYSYIVYRFKFEDKIESLVKYTVISLITLMFTVSIQMRAICCLVLPTFLGRSARNFLIATLIITLFNQPLSNTFDNIVVLSKWFRCMTFVGVDQGLAAGQLVFNPIQQITLKIATNKEVFGQDDSKYDDMMANMLSKLKPNANKDNKDVDDETSLGKFKDKMKKLCSKTQQKLKKCFANIIQERLWLPLQLTGFAISLYEKYNSFSICENKKFDALTKKVCLPNDNSSMSNDTSLNSAVNNLKLFATKNVKIEHNISLPDLSNVLKYKQVFKEAESYAKVLKTYTKLSSKMAKNLFLIVFLFVFFSSKSYHNKYLRDIKFDNNYITFYFRRIDARRKKANKMSLFPLKKIEKLEIIDPFGWKLTKIEKSHAKISTFLLILLLIFIYLFLQIDVLLYDLLDLIRIHIHTNVNQIGIHEMHPNVTGKDGYDGWLALKMRSFFTSFDFETHVNKSTSFSKCLPNPSQIPEQVNNEIYSSFLVICLLNYMEMYFLRYRRVICSYFYPIRAKKRTLYLYNQTLKKRKGYLRYAIQKVRQLVQKKLFERPNHQIVNSYAYGLINENNCGLLVKLIHKFLSFFIKKKCIICDEKLIENSYFKCPETKCSLNYCNQCWNECYQRCLVCKPEFFADF